MKSREEKTIYYKIYSPNENLDAYQQNKRRISLIREIEKQGWKCRWDHANELSTTAWIIGNPPYDNKGLINESEVTLWQRDSRLEKFLESYNPKTGGKK